MREDITENSLKTVNLFIIVKKKHKCALNLKKGQKIVCIYVMSFIMASYSYGFNINVALYQVTEQSLYIS